MHGMQVGDEKLYIGIEHGGRRVSKMFMKIRRSGWHVIWLIRRAN